MEHEEEPMCHSLIGADGRTHGRIVATALAAAVSLAALATAAWRTDTAPTALVRAEAAVLKAGTLTRSATTDTALIR
jgi:hypothetical protein